MNHHPNFQDFKTHAEDSQMVPVYRRLLSDTLTPVSAWCRLPSSSCSFLFESVVGGDQLGRYSFLGSDPFLTIEAHGTTVTSTTRSGETTSREVNDPLDELGQLVEKYQSPEIPELPGFCGGAVGYAGYDVIRYTENLPNAPHDDRKLPDMSFAFYDLMVVFDHISKTVYVVAHAATNVDDLQAEYDRALQRVDELCERLQQPTTGLQLTDINPDTQVDCEYESNFTQPEFESAVESCKEYIRAGDIFQVVISQRLKLETKARPIDIYRSLRVVNPSPFMLLLQTPSNHLIGSSPEIMVRVEDGEVTIRPLAGTRVRGANAAEDQRLAEELLADPKERAEHVMLIDLARNDVGRVADYGTVSLTDVMVVERYSHVMHITSNVNGQLKTGLSSLAALRAGLPAGTVSGAPKVRAMEIIDQIEPNRRGPYAGAVGYIDFTGNMDTCIALRTMVMQDNTVYVQAGAGIVADSVPETEYEETLSKARGLLKAIAVAEQQLSDN